jgi:hypothetical protein
MALEGLTDISGILEPLFSAYSATVDTGLRSEYARIIKGGMDHITVIRGGYRLSMP